MREHDRLAYPGRSQRSNGAHRLSAPGRADQIGRQPALGEGRSDSPWLPKSAPELHGRSSSDERARAAVRFAAYTAAIASIEPDTQALRKLQDAYAGTYILEDAYLSALVSGLEQRELGNLPNTQAAQRATIIQWRTQLTVLARRVGVTLPTDLQQAGRGEVAPSPGGS